MVKQSKGRYGSDFVIIQKQSFGCLWQIHWNIFEFSMGTIHGSTLAITLAWTIGILWTGIFLAKRIVSITFELLLSHRRQFSLVHLFWPLTASPRSLHRVCT